MAAELLQHTRGRFRTRHPRRCLCQQRHSRRRWRPPGPRNGWLRLGRSIVSLGRGSVSHGTRLIVETAAVSNRAEYTRWNGKWDWGRTILLRSGTRCPRGTCIATLLRAFGVLSTQRRAKLVQWDREGMHLFYLCLNFLFVLAFHHYKSLSFLYDQLLYVYNQN